MRISKDTFQFQLFNGAEYAPIATGTYEDCHAQFEAHASGTPRRVVLIEKARDARPKNWYRHSKRPTEASCLRPADQVQREYLEWAQAKRLLAVTVFSDHSVCNFRMKPARWERSAPDTSKPIFTGVIREVMSSDYFAVTEEQLSEAA